MSQVIERQGCRQASIWNVEPVPNRGPLYTLVLALVLLVGTLVSVLVLI